MPPGYSFLGTGTDALLAHSVQLGAKVTTLNSFARFRLTRLTEQQLFLDQFKGLVQILHIRNGL